MCTFTVSRTFYRPASAHNMTYKLEYLKDSNAAAHSVDSDIFYVYVVINLSARSESYMITFISKSSVKLWCVT